MSNKLSLTIAGVVGIAAYVVLATIFGLVRPELGILGGIIGAVISIYFGKVKSKSDVLILSIVIGLIGGLVEGIIIIFFTSKFIGATFGVAHLIGLSGIFKSLGAYPSILIQAMLIGIIIGLIGSFIGFLFGKKESSN